MSFFQHVPLTVPDEIILTSIKYRADSSPQKVDLGIGAYRTNEGKPFVLPTVTEAETRIFNAHLPKEYLPMEGDVNFIQHAQKLLFGDEFETSGLKERTATAQSISGTGSVRVGLDFLSKFLPQGTLAYVSKPTWGNHLTMFEAAHLPYKYYRYWDALNRKLDLQGLLEDIRNAPERSVIVLHACAHNPTGVDPTQDEWIQIAQVIQERNHLPFFDCAYQGFASGDLVRDAWAIRYFIEQGFEMLVAQSFAKNFGLYNDRVGTISTVCKSAEEAKAVLSQMKMVIRPNYSNPPAHGARIVATILGDANLYAQWKEELKVMSGRIMDMRRALRETLEGLKTPGDWSHITSQIGMFSFTGLTPNQCAAMIEKYHIYLVGNGRISMAGLNTNNIKYVAEAIHDVVTSIHE